MTPQLKFRARSALSLTLIASLACAQASAQPSAAPATDPTPAASPAGDPAQTAPQVQRAQPVKMPLLKDQPATALEGELKASAPTSAAELAERFYEASDPQALKAARDALASAHPDSALRWEVESIYASLTLQPRREVEAALKALAASKGSDALVSYDRAIGDWDLDQLDAYTDALLRLARDHLDPATRAAAAWTIGHSAHYQGDRSASRIAKGVLGPLLPLTIIGTWDNDQGKGLDQPFPPEGGLDLSARYQGKLMEIGWRTSYPLDLRGKINLDELMSPSTWQVAYGASAFRVEAPSQAELRVSSSEPLKVWVNGELMLNVNRVSGWQFDGFVVPVSLRAGVNNVLIKSAQDTGSWLLAARLTALGGGPIEYVSVAADTPIASPTPGAQPRAPLGVSEVIEWHQRARALQAGTARSAVLLSELLGRIGLTIERVERAERALKVYPESLLVKRTLAQALWAHGERGRAADLLSGLYKAAGDQLPAFTLSQTSFWTQQQLDVKARATLRALVESKPELIEPRLRLSKLYSKKGWDSERCALIRDGLKHAPYHMGLLEELKACEETLGHPLKSRSARDLLDEVNPWHYSTITRRYREAARDLHLSEQLNASRDCVQWWPQESVCYLYLAKSLRAIGDLSGALTALAQLEALNPLDARPYIYRGEWLADAGREEEALTAWRAALERDPDNQALTLRLNELHSSGAELWMSDVPTEEQITKVLTERASLKAAEGADVINLIDDEVTRLNADGSTVNIITTVSYAVNQEGRDKLTKMYISRSKSTQLMAAYALNPDNTRVEASSIRDGVVRFRKLEVGSAVVLQYRHHTRPSQYLTGSISRFWWFHNESSQVRDSRFVLWLPKGTALYETPHAPPPVKGEALAKLEREERLEGELRRVSWRMRDLPPLVTESRMPPRRDMVYALKVSTVPSWDDMWKWERELLREAFRVSPKVKEVTDEVLQSSVSVKDKVLKIHEYVIENIRYQQDYEQSISGVKPHNAAQVLSRQYGDCKDKAVLFITMAKLAGIEAHFALVRTRNSGLVDQQSPSQQFNHAIVYVPKQEGFSEGRFFDPTVDTLDIETLRFDDQGTRSLVFNPETKLHYWQEIPFQGPEFDSTRDDIELTLSETGEVTGKLTLSGRGSIAQTLRHRARNPEAFKQVMQYRLNNLFPGATMDRYASIELEDLFKPASAEIYFKHDSWAKVEGDSLRIPAVIDWTPKGYFHLDKRRFPIDFGTRKEWTWRTTLSLPSSFEVTHLPQDESLVTGCLSLERRSRIEEDSLITEWRYASLCEMLEPTDYEAQRDTARQMMVLLDQEVVLGKKVPTTPQELKLNSPTAETPPSAQPASTPDSNP